MQTKSYSARHRHTEDLFVLKFTFILIFSLASLPLLADSEPIISCRLENYENDPSNQRLNIYEMENGQVLAIWRSFDFIKMGNYEGGVQDVIAAFNNKTSVSFQKSRQNPTETLKITFGTKFTRVNFPDGGKTDLICVKP